jgi:CMP-N-acetylneuraminic acid synthetase
MTTWAFIPARAGSQRIPGKNLAHVGNRTLLERAIRAAADAGCEVVVSSDSTEVIDCASGYLAAYLLDAQELPPHLTVFAPHHRPEHLAGPHAQIEDAIAHWLVRSSLADDDVICLLQPTSPFRRPETIRACVDLVTTHKLDAAMAIKRDFARATLNGRVRGLWSEREQRDVGYRVIWNHPPDFRPRSQDTRNVGVDCGLCYAFTAGHFRRTGSRMAQITGAVVVGEIEAFDIDTPAQLEAARLLAPHAERLMEMEETGG